MPPADLRTVVAVTALILTIGAGLLSIEHRLTRIERDVAWIVQRITPAPIANHEPYHRTSH